MTTISPLNTRPPATTIELSLPAEAQRAVLVRTLAGTIAVVEDFDIDAIADLRLAVDEVFAATVEEAAPASTMRCAFELSRFDVRFSAEVECATRPQPPAEGTLVWQILQTLADEVTVEVIEPHGSDSAYLLRVCVCKRRAPSGA